MKTEDIVKKINDLPNWQRAHFVDRQIANSLQKQKDDVFFALLPFAHAGSLCYDNKKLAAAISNMTNKQIDLLFLHQKSLKFPDPTKMFLPFMFLGFPKSTPPAYLIEKTREACQDKTAYYGQDIFWQRQLNLLEKLDKSKEGREVLLDFEFQKDQDCATIIFFRGSDELVSAYMERNWGPLATKDILGRYLDMVRVYSGLSEEEKEVSVLMKMSPSKLSTLMNMLKKEKEIPLPLIKTAYLLYQEGSLPKESHAELLSFFKHTSEEYKSYCVFLSGSPETKERIDFNKQKGLSLSEKETFDILTRYISRETKKISKEDMDAFAKHLVPRATLKVLIEKAVSERNHHPIDFKATTHLIDFLDQKEKVDLASDIIKSANRWSLPDKRVIKHLIKDCQVETVQKIAVPTELTDWWKVVSIKKTKKEIKGVLEGTLKQKVSQPKRRM